MTDNELLELKALAGSCYVFGSDNDHKLDKRLVDVLSICNGEFFEKAVKAIPELVDELIELRRWLENCECNYCEPI